jgi:adenine-specific DNA-methyltransferase
MEKLKMHSTNLVEQNIEKLAALFPNCVTEAKGADGKLQQAIDFDLLKQELSRHIVEGPQERYQLNWPGKREALLTANAPIAKTLRPCREESVNFDTTQNLFIEGDNLDALKLLQETYLGKVKMIYIDPPYNTGNDFIYHDDFAENIESYIYRSNQVDEHGNRLASNTESNGRFHSDWLSMMYSRLKLAKNLLKDDGVAFISIDDCEQTNLNKIAEEIFGEENFISQIVWQRSKKGDSKLISKVHEYILCYAKSKVSLLETGIWRKKKEGVNEVLEKYTSFRSKFNNNHTLIRQAMQEWFKSLSVSDPKKAHKHYNWSDENGLYFPDNFAGPDDGRLNRPRHDILHPVTGKPCKKPSTGWRWDESKTKWALEQEPPRIHFGIDESTIPNRKSYLKETSFEPFSSVFYRDGRSATLEVESFVGKGVFQFPKNTEILQELIELATKENDIILDFFAGSASTGHALYKTNANSSSSRKFILIQINESCDKEGFDNIAEVSKKRLSESGKKINASLGDGITTDVGFRVLKIDSSNMSDVYYNSDSITQADLFSQVENVKSERTEEDLLFQVMLDWGVDLALPIHREPIDGKTVFFVDAQSDNTQGALVACFDKTGGINEDFIKQLAGFSPLRLVFRDAGFSSDAAKINVEQLLKQLSPTTDVKTI